MAEDFAAKFGRDSSYESKRWWEIAEASASGDFVYLNYNGTGVITHIGFITAGDAYEGVYQGWAFMDFQIAQHTSNYIGWTSTTASNWFKNCWNVDDWPEYHHRYGFVNK